MNELDPLTKGYKLCNLTAVYIEYIILGITLIFLKEIVQEENFQRDESFLRNFLEKILHGSKLYVIIYKKKLHGSKLGVIIVRIKTD